MKRFKQYLQDANDDKILTLVSKEKKDRRKKDDKDTIQNEPNEDESLNEVSIKPNTARIIALMLLARINTIRSKAKSEESLTVKINHLTDLMTQMSYLAILNIATDQSDATLLRKIPKK